MEKIGPGGQVNRIGVVCHLVGLVCVSRPLSEGKSLKSKFDDIFASTRYTTALDNFKTIQKELVCGVV